MGKFREIDKKPRRLFAVGDIHACVDELRLMLDFLRNSAGLGQDDIVVFIGDYIDRGPDSKGVIDLLLEFRKDFPETVFLKGNHEDMLLNFLGFDGRNGEIYLYNGGLECLSSYNLMAVDNRAGMLSKLPQEHIEFYKSLESHVGIGGYIFAHAGLNPLRPVKEQVDEDLFWIRNEFILSAHPFQKTVIFGHTPCQDIMFNLPYKIGIDTGCVYGNMLSCVELMNGQIYQIGRGEDEVATRTFAERLGSGYS